MKQNIMKKKLLTLASIITLATNTQAQLNFAPAVNYGAGTNPTSVTSADFNGDGRIDFAVANQGVGLGYATIHIGSGTGIFAPAVSYGAGSMPLSLTSGDFNGDGKIDLVTANYSGGDVSILLGSGTGTFAAAVNYTAGTNPVSVISADLMVMVKLI
jgi:hypothetical protein